MRKIVGLCLFIPAAIAHAWGLSGLAYYQQYQTTSPVAQTASDSESAGSYNQGYTDGFNEAHGLMGRHGYGPRYEDGYTAARSQAEATWRLNHPY